MFFIHADYICNVLSCTDAPLTGFGAGGVRVRGPTHAEVRVTLPQALHHMTAGNPCFRVIWILTGVGQMPLGPVPYGMVRACQPHTCCVGDLRVLAVVVQRCLEVLSTANLLVGNADAVQCLGLKGWVGVMRGSLFGRFGRGRGKLVPGWS